MATCFVYLRRSLDRNDKQENSMEIQKDWIMGLLAERPDLDVL